MGHLHWTHPFIKPHFPSGMSPFNSGLPGSLSSILHEKYSLKQLKRLIMCKMLIQWNNYKIVTFTQAHCSNSGCKRYQRSGWLVEIKFTSLQQPLQITGNEHSCTFTAQLLLHQLPFSTEMRHYIHTLTLPHMTTLLSGMWWGTSSQGPVKSSCLA